MDEQTTSTEQSSSQQSNQQQTETQPSLEDVYKKFNVEEAASSFQQRTERVEQVPQRQDGNTAASLSVPDPVLNPEDYKKWQAGQSQFVQQALTNLHGELTQMRAERVKAKEEADIKNAVQRFKSVSGEDVDDDIAEVALGQKARKDPKFLAVYQNRDRNPAAWNAAVSAYANEFKSRSQFKIDPQIAENQRAAKQSIGSQSRDKTDEPQGDEKLFQGKSGSEFERVWRNYIDR
jgi:hypothetical protein